MLARLSLGSWSEVSFAANTAAVSFDGWEVEIRTWGLWSASITRSYNRLRTSRRSDARVT